VTKTLCRAQKAIKSMVSSNAPTLVSWYVYRQQAIVFGRNHMSEETTQAAEAIRTIWQGNPSTMAELDEECNPNKVCRNMKDVTYEGFGEEGTDVASAWKAKLAREGKLATGASIADLVFGTKN
jgi:hypothetical protein